MASYVIHNIAGVELLRILKDRMGYEISSDDYNKFLMGNLIPDSSQLSFPPLDNSISKDKLDKEKVRRAIAIQKEKQITHFRSFDDEDKTIQIPQIVTFINKYKHLFSKDISVLGYLYHLYTDKLFFGDLFPNSFVFLDENHKPTDRLSLTRTVQLNSTKKEYDVSAFFNQDSEVSLYSDYTRMNSFLMKKYNIRFDKEKLLRKATEFINPGIEEVSYENISAIINKTADFIESSKTLTDYRLRVLREIDVDNFINAVVESFIILYKREIDQSIKRKTYIYVPKKQLEKRGN